MHVFRSCSEQESYVASGHVFSSFPISVSDFRVQILFPISVSEFCFLLFHMPLLDFFDLY